MAHVAKYNRGAIGHLCRHFERGTDSEGNAIKYGNQDINIMRSSQNYNLAPNRDSQVKFIQDRCSEVKCSKRADVNVMCSWVITVPYNVPEREYRHFFEESYNFLSNRYGERNIISSYVHMDETTPHMHFAFVPVVSDKNKKIDKVSAKELLTRKELQTFHGDLDKHLESRFDFKISVLNGAPLAGNKSVEELKRDTAIEEYTRATERALKAQEDAKSIEIGLEPLNAEYKAKQAVIDGFIKNSQFSEKIPDYAKHKKPIFGDEQITVPLEKWIERTMTQAQINSFREAKTEFERNLNNFKQSSSAEYIKSLQSRINSLEYQIRELRNENDTGYEKRRELTKQIKKMEIEELKAAESFMQEEKFIWKTLEKFPEVKKYVFGEVKRFRQKEYEKEYPQQELQKEKTKPELKKDLGFSMEF